VRMYILVKKMSRECICEDIYSLIFEDIFPSTCRREQESGKKSRPIFYPFIKNIYNLVVYSRRHVDGTLKTNNYYS
jgi:hypothetical protein